VAIAVSEANDCQFCVAAHSTIAKHMAKADPAAVAAARRNVPTSDTKLDAL
jgi:AhpD family alkylhydroperoxidase